MAAIDRLEQMLREWEDGSFWLSVLVRMQLCFPGARVPFCPLEGPLVYWRDFRGYLLGLRQGDAFDSCRFIGPTELQTAFPAAAPIATELARWSSQSRRVFSLSEDLQFLLEGTDLGDFKIRDIPWPFPSFLVTLAVPIVSWEGVCWDAILVSSAGESGPVVTFRLLAQGLETRGGFTPRIIGDLEDALRRKKVSRMRTLLQRYQDTLRHIPMALLELNKQTGSPISAVQGIVDAHSADLEAAVRIVTGLALYLTTLQSGGGHQSSWTPVCPSTKDPTVIINTALVCSVSSTHVIEPTMRQAIISGRHTESTNELRVHFRRGHWRRPPGQGSDPLAVKAVHVRPTMVRADRLVAGAVPGGSESKVR